jgi:hypothetical protein
LKKIACILASFLLGQAFLATLPAGAAPGFFTVRQENGVWWLVDGQGKKFYAKAVNCVGTDATPSKFNPANPAYCPLCQNPSVQAWQDATVKRLSGWGFNTLGGYCDTDFQDKGRLPYSLALTLAGWGVGFPWGDIKSPAGQEEIHKQAVELKKYRNDTQLIGYFLDNEMGWWDEAVFQTWMAKPYGERIKKKLWAMLQEEYGSRWEAFQADFKVSPKPGSLEDVKDELKSVTWGPGRRPPVVDKFMEWLADEYYAFVSGEVREADPNHLILGDRYASAYSEPVARAAGRYCDVVTTNYNTQFESGWVSPAFFESLYKLGRKPVMVTEYYFSARQNASQDANKHGPYILVDTQAQRAAGAKEMTERLARLPFMVGAHWFQWSDEPPHGRNDGEDFNFGLVDVKDQAYPELTAALSEANARVDSLHAVGRIGAGLGGWKGRWLVPQAHKALMDGELKGWSQAASWVPGARSVAPYEPTGDFYVTWKPDGLYVGLVFWDYDWNTTKTVPADFQRLEIAVGDAAHRVQEVQVSGFFERLGPDPGEKKQDKRPWADLNVERVEGETRTQTADVQAMRKIPAQGLTAMTEVRLPPSMFGKKAFAAGDVLNLGLALRLRGDTKQTFWPNQLTDAVPAASSLAPIVLGR